jgi:hypothetical protein
MSVLEAARKLIAELDAALSHGTPLRRVPWDSADSTENLLEKQACSASGTDGTRGTAGTAGTIETEEASVADPADLISDYHERVAICLEAGDCAEDAAHRIASEQCGATLVELAARQVAYWRHRIEALPEPTDRRLSNVRCIALDCLTLPWAYQAATLGWTAGELFGLHRDAANVRVEAMGLVSSLALSKLRPPLQVVDISESAATVSTGSGAMLTHRRLRSNLGCPIWRHPAFSSASTGMAC